ncbi:hypothetical protein FOZ62_003154 [Perkinsus olseni]|uniref:Proline dehydrogenase n=1 Tax=Perkinsus olseni TaxID=32597 RepID=A0A7J6QXR7_PEROL|nr:hypothetical protein FOZ62_003154 [Perkinsus olseni]
MLGASLRRPMAFARPYTACLVSRRPLRRAFCTTPTKRQELPLDDAKIAFRWKSTGEVLRGWLVLKLCTYNYVIKNAEKLYQRSRSILGDGITHGVIRRTLFAHFCAGESDVGIRPKLQRLHEAGVTAILDPVDEGDVSPAGPPSTDMMGPSAPERADTMQARIFDYEGERRCDSRVDLVKAAISTVDRAVQGKGIAAMKISAMGPPVLLERMSNGIRELQSFYSHLYDGHECALSYEELKEALVSVSGSCNTADIQDRFAKLDDNGDGKVDLMDWMNSVSLTELTEIMMREPGVEGPRLETVLTEDDLALLQSMYRRVDAVCKAAFDSGVKILIDAEWTAIQPAIDKVAASMMRKYNRDDRKGPIVYNTYQTYLKDTRQRVRRDLQMAQREGYRFACKVVRGAYIVSERMKAEEDGRESPICDTYEATSASYHGVIEDLLDHASRPSIIIATHNAETVKFAVGKLSNCPPERRDDVMFAQLYGMADPITYILAKEGYRACKLVPYGPISNVVPYLIRRAQENSAMLGTPAVAQERALLFAEAWRRLTGRGS